MRALPQRKAEEEEAAAAGDVTTAARCSDLWQCCVLPVLQAETQAALLDASLALSAALILAAVLLCPCLALLASDREVQQVCTRYLRLLRYGCSTYYSAQR